jgi:hypothetical protein
MLPAERIRFPGSCPRGDGLVLNDADHDCIAHAIGPCHGGDIEDFLAAAPTVPGGRYLDTDHPLILDVLDAIGTEVRGYMKLDEERDGKPRTKPKRGSTAERLAAIYDRIADHLA